MYHLFLWRLFVCRDFVRLRLQLNLWFWTRPCATPRDFPPWGQPSVQQQLAGYCCHRSVHQGRPQIMRWLGSGFVEIGLEYVRSGRSGASRAFVALRVQDVVCTGSSRGSLWNTLLILIVAEAHRRERVNPQLYLIWPYPVWHHWCWPCGRRGEHEHVPWTALLWMTPTEIPEESGVWSGLIQHSDVLIVFGLWNCGFGRVEPSCIHRKVERSMVLPTLDNWKEHMQDSWSLQHGFELKDQQA